MKSRLCTSNTLPDEAPGPIPQRGIGQIFVVEGQGFAPSRVIGLLSFALQRSNWVSACHAFARPAPLEPFIRAAAAFVGDVAYPARRRFQSLRQPWRESEAAAIRQLHDHPPTLRTLRSQAKPLSQLAEAGAELFHNLSCTGKYERQVPPAYANGSHRTLSWTRT